MPWVLYSLDTRIGMRFRAIELITTLSTRWTYNLADHLKILDADDDRHEYVVLIFHCASFLLLQKHRSV